MTSHNAKLLALVAIVAMAGVAIYRGKGFDPRRMVAIALVGAGILFVAGPAPQIAAALSALMVADVLVLNKNGAGFVAAVGNIAAPGASTATTSTSGGVTTTTTAGGTTHTKTTSTGGGWTTWIPGLGVATQAGNWLEAHVPGYAALNNAANDVKNFFSKL